MVVTVTGGFKLYPANQREGVLRQRHVPGGRRPDGRARRPPVRRRRERAVLEGPLHVHVARRRQLDLQRLGDRPRAGGLPRRPRGDARARRPGNLLLVNNWYVGLYAQDAWRAVEPRDRQRRPALGAVLRPERRERRASSIFRHGELPEGRQEHGVPQRAGRSHSIRAIPGFPTGQTGLNKQWWNLSPRVGVAWDVHGDGRLAVRSSYAMAYDFLSRRVPQHQRRRAAVRQPLARPGSAGSVRRSVSEASAAIRIRS